MDDEIEADLEEVNPGSHPLHGRQARVEDQEVPWGFMKPARPAPCGCPVPMRGSDLLAGMGDMPGC